MRLTETSPNAHNIHFDCRVSEYNAGRVSEALSEGELYPGWMRFAIIFGLSGLLWVGIFYLVAKLFF